MMRSRAGVVVAVAVGVLAIGAGGSSKAERVRDALTSAIEADVASDPAIPGEIVTVRAPGVDETVATGFADVDAQVPLEPGTPFRVASMTKTVVAAAILRLVEEGELRLNDPIAEHLDPETLTVLRADGYDPDRITVRQLLNHTGGFYDYAADPRYETRAVSDPQHRWTRFEQLQLATELGDPLGEPGEVYGYSDTGYILLGEILENVTGETLPAAVRSLIPFDELGLDHTYWEILEDAPPGYPARAHQYFGPDIDNIGFDASQDLYGGGGLVSTTEDLARFYEGLFTGKVFEKPSTLRTMTKPAKASGDEKAGMGIYTVDAAGERCYGHRGFWGTQTIACPDLDLTFARTTNQADDEDFDDDALEIALMEALGER
jgi:D-alanyl-D-alanine carboxypeptidase